jgi:6-phosphofructokinase 1
MAKRIGILTSGGDCGGLNAVVRAAVFRAQKEGVQIVGIHDGTAGLLRDPIDYEVLSPSQFDGHVLRMGGTILGTTNKGDPFALPGPDGKPVDRSEDMVANIRALGIDALIGIGGDGSQKILLKLSRMADIPLIAVPKTIDNDVAVTESSVGFDTAVFVATEALDRLQPTAASHDRVMVLEVMGRDAGHIALHAGIAGGADVILIPEIPYSIAKVAEHIKNIRRAGRNFALVVVSEAIRTVEGELHEQEFTDGQKRYGGVGHHVGARIAELTGAETRVTVLGHVQRGSPPTHYDRLIASAFGVRAVELALKGKRDRMLAWSNRQVVDVSLEKAVQDYQTVDIGGTLVKTARGLNISLGD